MYLLDTDILIYALKGNEIVLGHFQEKAAVPKAISVITFGELYYGAMKSKRQMENLAKVRHVGELFLVIDVTPAIMETFASLKAELEAEGRRVDDFDLIIAATALVMGYRLVTNNERHFTSIPGLEIENWSRMPR